MSPSGDGNSGWWVHRAWKGGTRLSGDWCYFFSMKALMRSAMFCFMLLKKKQ